MGYFLNLFPVSCQRIFFRTAGSQRKIVIFIRFSYHLLEASNPRRLGEKRERYHRAMPRRPTTKVIGKTTTIQALQDPAFETCDLLTRPSWSPSLPPFRRWAPSRPWLYRLIARRHFNCLLFMKCILASGERK